MIQYDSPSITEDLDRPDPYENSGFPYHALDPRRFEEFIYCLYSNQLGQTGFEHFDSISLMSGTKDKGRDCVLVKNQKNYGLIQCKKYGRNLSIEDIGLEITKFVMYSLIEPDLIHDPKDFTYFIASAKSFDNACISYLNNFNYNISTDTRLDKWISKLTKNSSLQHLELEGIGDRVLSVMQNLKVRMIAYSDLDKLLHEPRNIHVTDLFFKIKTFVDEAGIKRIEDKLDSLIQKRYSPEELLQELQRASYSVSEEKNYLEGIKESHIERTETQQIVEWVETRAEVGEDRKARNICLLAANAGMGKTVIIKDAYDRLSAQNVPVLALKADKVYATNLKELQDRIGIPVPLHHLIDQCLQQHQKVVIMIDQIDALSQSLSASRDFLITYTQLVAAYKGRENVRFVISVRFFDLYYDRGLRVYKNQKTIEVGLLTKEMVITQTEKLGLRKKEVSSALLSLLQVPNNLDVFSRIYTAKGKFSEINSLQDLYGELYRIKILKPTASSIKTKPLRELLGRIVEQMYSSQQITVSEINFEHYPRELDYLKSEQIIKLEGGRLQFFHQTFYDYLYAKSFIAKKMSVMTFINRSDQSIMIRSGLKMILNFTRETDQVLYERYLRSIIDTKSLRFHIKHLVVTMLASERSPTENEKYIFLELITKELDFFAVFCEHVMGGTWLKLLIENNLLAPMTKAEPEKSTYCFDGILSSLLPTTQKRKKRIAFLVDIIGQMLRRNIDGNENQVIEFCETIQDLDTVKWLLFNNRDWKNKKAVRLFEKCFPTGDSDHHGFFMVLEHISHVDPLYVFNKIKGSMTILDRDRNTSLRQNQNSKMLAMLMNSIPEVFLDHVTETVTREGKTLPERSAPGEIVTVYNVKDILKKDINLHDTDNIFKLLGLGMRKQAGLQSAYFKNYLKKHLTSELGSILNILAFALEGNEELYTNEIITLFEHLKNGNALNDYDELNGAVRRLIRNAVRHLKADQTEGLAHSMLKITSKIDFTRYHKFSPEAIIWPNCYGRTKFKYLRCIPKETILSNHLLKRAYAELNRKFDRLRDDADYLGPARTPVRESAYANMDMENWLSSFRKYNSLKQTVFTPLGGLYEHSERYGEELKKAVEKHMPLIRETVFNLEINLSYAVKGLEALYEKGHDILEMLKFALSRNPQRMDLYYLVELCGKLIRAEEVDPEIFGYILIKSKTPFRPNGITLKDDNYRNEVEIQERAINALIHVRKKSLGAEVFLSLHKAMGDAEPRVQKFIMVNSAHLLALDTPKTMDLFIANLHKIDTAKKLNANAWSMGFLAHRDFKGLVPLFERALGFTEEIERTAENMTNILLGCWYAGHAGAKELFWKFFHHSEEAKSNALSKAFEYFYEDGSIQPANLEILYAAIGSGSKKVRQRFRIKFLHIEHIEFVDLEEWLYAYTKSNSFLLSDYFLEYLVSNLAQHPKKCVDLFELAISNRHKFADPETNEIRSDETTTKFIIGAYNALPSTEKAYKQRLMKLFDKTLLDFGFRKNAENILDKIIE